MNFVTLKTIPWLALLISSGLLVGAWFFQYVLGFPPCQMCYWQRHAHKVIIGLAVLAILLNYFDIGSPKMWAGFIALAFLVSVGIAFWHVGVEYKWWEGPKTCMTGTPEKIDFDPNTFLNSLDAPQKLPGCDTAVWHFLGLSMAGWNALISLFGLSISLLSFKERDHV